MKLPEFFENTSLTLHNTNCNTVQIMQMRQLSHERKREYFTSHLIEKKNKIL